MFGQLCSLAGLVSIFTMGMLYAAPRPPAEKGTDVKFATVQTGTQGGPEKAEQSVATTPEEWAKLWKNYRRNLVPAPALPEVNFEKEMIVAVAMGTKPSGGYAIAIKRIEKTDKGVVVHYRETAPAPGGIGIAVLTQPFHIIRLEKGGPVTFVKDAD
jgi:PrcB C-terminal